ncbi:MAG: PAS domain S-box protein [Syntrophorhabdaceae bacterium]|nr:PAS domain S-box protein [Syntrophorhabdaceae bacterium]
MKYRYWLVLFLSVLVVCAALFGLFYNRARKDAINNLNDQQLIIALQTKKGIEGFFRFHRDSLVRNAAQRHVVNLNHEGRASMEIIYNAFSENVAGVTRVDEKGRIVYTFPYDAKSIGRDISFQPHMREILKTHKPVMSDVFTAVQGFRTIALHVPVFDGETFKGTLGFLIRFEHIAREYLENIRIGRDGYAWLISKEGIELFCPVPGHNGRSVFENCKDFPSILSMAREMMEGKKGITTYEYDMVRGRKTASEVKHAVYVPINLVNTFWSIVIATPDSEVVGALSEFRSNLLIIFGILILFSIPSSYFGARAWKILSEETKRKEAEESLRKSEERYRALFDSSVDSIIILSRDRTPIDLNAAAAKLFGFSGKDEFLKRTVENGSPEYQPDGSLSSVKAREMMEIAFDKGSHAFEWIHKKVDGTEFPSAVLLSRMTYQGKEVLQASIRDISDQRAAEKERLEMEKRILHSQKLESLGVLAGGLAHEFNNILTVIQASLEIVLIELKKGSPVTISYIDGALDASKKAGDLTSRMLAYAGKSVISAKKKVDLNTVAQTSLALCRASIEGNVEVHLNGAMHLPSINADVNQVQQVAINLITNAFEAIGPKKGSIIVSTGVEDCDNGRLKGNAIEDSQAAPGRFVFLEVADTGCGIDEATRKHLFEPFYSTRFLGRGLGLPAILGIVRSHGGAIFIDSTPNKGTTIRVLFPAKSEK